MSHQLRAKRFNLTLVAYQTRQMLLSFLGLTIISLFVLQLFLVNQLSMNGYLMSREATKFATLSQENERLDSEMARLQAQEYTNKITSKGTLVSRGNSRFVYISNYSQAKVDVPNILFKN